MIILHGWEKCLYNVLMILKGASVVLGIVIAFILSVILLHYLSCVHPIATLIGFCVVLLLGAGAIVALNYDWIVW